jgi:hypothetical protein
MGDVRCRTAQARPAAHVPKRLRVANRAASRSWRLLEGQRGHCPCCATYRRSLESDRVPACGSYERQRLLCLTRPEPSPSQARCPGRPRTIDQTGTSRARRWLAVTPIRTRWADETMDASLRSRRSATRLARACLDIVEEHDQPASSTASRPGGTTHPGAVALGQGDAASRNDWRDPASW